MLKWTIICGMISFMITGCQKEHTVLRSAPTLDKPLQLQLDSACMHAPNIISMNGDGINDGFWIVTGEIPSIFSLTIINPNGTTVFSSSEQNRWSDFDSEFADQDGPIPYLYSLHLITAAGTEYQVSKVFHLIKDNYNECISSDIAPLFGDQLDPRRCDIPYATNDLVCIE